MMNILDGLVKTKTKHLRNYKCQNYVWIMFFGIFLQTMVWGQTSGPVLGPQPIAIDCNVDTELQQLLTEDFEFRTKFFEYQNDVYNKMSTQTFTPSSSSTTCGPIRIPVVFHIFSDPETPVGLMQESNITDKQIIELLDELNWRLANGPEDYPLDGGDGEDYDFNFIGTDLEIQFVLATKNAEGDDDIGIVRYEDNNTAYLNGTNNSWAVINELLWPSDQFAKIAVFQKKCNTTTWTGDWGPEDACLCTPLTPSATFPPSAGNFEDGFAFGSKHFFSTSSLAHEVGHYLGLFHTFDLKDYDLQFNQVGIETPCDNVDCLLDGDQICDTPPQGQSNSCDDNSCGSDAASGPFTGDISDFTENYMGNTHNYRSAFTTDQVQRMHVCLDTDPNSTGNRANLNNSPNGNAIDMLYLLDWDYQDGCIFTSETQPIFHLLNLSNTNQVEIPFEYEILTNDGNETLLTSENFVLEEIAGNLNTCPFENSVASIQLSEIGCLAPGDYKIRLTVNSGNALAPNNRELNFKIIENCITTATTNFNNTTTDGWSIVAPNIGGLPPSFSAFCTSGGNGLAINRSCEIYSPLINLTNAQSAMFSLSTFFDPVTSQNYPNYDLEMAVLASIDGGATYEEISYGSSISNRYLGGQSLGPVDHLLDNNCSNGDWTINLNEQYIGEVVLLKIQVSLFNPCSLEVILDNFDMNVTMNTGIGTCDVNISSSQNSDGVCELTAEPILNGQDINISTCMDFLWTYPDGTTSNCFQILADIPGDYNLVINTPDGCTVSTTYTINFAGMASSEVVCVGNNFELNDFLVGSGASLGGDWYPPEGGNTLGNTDILFNNVGDFIYTYYFIDANNNCTSQTIYTVNIIDCGIQSKADCIENLDFTFDKEEDFSIESQEDLDLFISDSKDDDEQITINATLTLVGGSGTNYEISGETLRFGPDGRIIVDENAALGVETTTFESATECMWQGIQLRTSSLLSSNEPGNIYNTSFSVSNPIYIKNAVIGIIDFETEPINIQTIADNSDKPTDYGFNSELLSPVSSFPLGWVKKGRLGVESNNYGTDYGLGAFNFQDCFKGIYLEDGNVSFWGIIHKFSVESSLYPMSVDRPSFAGVEINNTSNKVAFILNIFEGMEYGIKATNTGDILSLGSAFHFPKKGISVASIQSSKVDLIGTNKFQLCQIAGQFEGVDLYVENAYVWGDNTPSTWDNLDNNTVSPPDIGFLVMGSTFTFIEGYQPNYFQDLDYGIVLLNNSTESGLIEKNNFINNEHDIWFAGDNEGTEVKCNTFTNYNNSSWRVTPSYVSLNDQVDDDFSVVATTLPNLQPQGFCSFNGSGEPRTNTFVSNNSTSSEFDIQGNIFFPNNFTFEYKCFWDDPLAGPDPNTALFNITGSNSSWDVAPCPSTFGSFGSDGCLLGKPEAELLDDLYSLGATADDRIRNSLVRELLSIYRKSDLTETNLDNIESLSGILPYDKEAEKALLLSVDNEMTNRRVIPQLIREGEFEEVINKIASLPDENQEQQDYKAFYEIYNNVRSSDRSFYELSDVEENQIREIAGRLTKASFKARILLESFYGEEHPVILINPENGQLFGINFKTDESSYQKESPYFSSIMPNPVSDISYVHYTLPEAEKAEISLYNSWGVLIEIKAVEGKGVYNLNSASLESGLYYLECRLYSNSESYTQKVMIH